MQFKKALFALALIAFAAVANASTVVVTFEDGIGFDADVTTNVRTSYCSGCGFGLFGDYYGHGGRQAVISFAAPVVFNGTFYNAWGSDFDHSYRLYNEGNLVYEGAPTAGCCDLYWVASGYSGLIDEIVLYGSSDGVALDNFTYTTTAAPVPEPETYAMLLAGLGLMGAVARRRKA